MPNVSVTIIELLVAVHLALKVVHSNDVNVSNAIRITNVLATRLVLINIVSILVLPTTILHVPKMQFVSFEIMYQIVVVQMIFQMVIHCLIVNVLFMILSPNAKLILIVQVNWLVYGINVWILVENYHHALRQLNVVFWIVLRLEQWFANVQNYGYLIKMANVDELSYHHRQVVKRTVNALTMNLALIDNVATHVIVEFIQHVWYKIIEPFALVSLDMKETRTQFVVLLDVASILNVIPVKHV